MATLIGYRDGRVDVANADMEIVPLMNATDLRDWLITKQVDQFLCVVENSDLHGRGYLFPKGCNGDDPGQGDPTVLESTVNWMRTYVGGS